MAAFFASVIWMSGEHARGAQIHPLRVVPNPHCGRTYSVAKPSMQNVNMRDCLYLLTGLPVSRLAELVRRIDTIPLHAHAYSHHLNLRLGTEAPADMLAFAARHSLQGLNIHVEDGEARSLRHMSPEDRHGFGLQARALGLALHVETSSTALEDLQEAVEIAHATGARAVRCYPRHHGPLSHVIARTIEDLRRLDAIDPGGKLAFRLEQHEDLKAAELLRIVTEVANPRLSLLFDFGNMVNAFETPDHAFAIMAPKITEAHIKDIRIGEDRGGWSQIACKSGEGQADFHRLLLALLLLGEEKPQVTAYALQEENGMVSPAFRFPGEPADPVIAWRAPSTTDPEPGESLDRRLDRERREADEQVAHVRGVLEDLKIAASRILARQGIGV